MNKTAATIFMYSLGALIVVGFFMALVYLSVTNDDGKYTTTISDMVSAIKYSIILIVGYYWGSSAGSAAKNDLIVKNGKSENNNEIIKP